MKRNNMSPEPMVSFLNKPSLIPELLVSVLASYTSHMEVAGCNNKVKDP